jgi:CubicO group peptidase (beta-lactamase class C family)
VIARVSGKPYPDFMREEVFEPLGLTHTSVDVPAGAKVQQALRYGEDGLPIPFYEFDHTGGSAIYSSAHDLVRFAMFHMKAHLRDQRAILSDAAIEAMQARTTPQGGPGYGIGWSIRETGGYKEVSHGGGMGGVSTTLRMFPRHKIAVVVLSNSAGSLPHRIAESILRQLLPDMKPAADPPKSNGPFRPSAQMVGTWSGSIATYKSDVPVVMDVLDSGDVQVRLGSSAKVPLNGVRFENGMLEGRTTGDLGTDDAGRRPYNLLLNLTLRGDVLNGSCTAQSLPGKRVGNALTYWAELKQQRASRSEE